MAKALHCIIMQATKFALNKSNVFVLFCDEITLIDN
jgi:hypothetical protein